MVMQLPRSRAQRRADARKRRANKPVFPVACERSYRAFLMRRVRLANEVLKDQLKPLFDKLGKGINERSRADQSDLDRFLNAVSAVERGFKRRQIPNQSAINGHANAVDRFTSGQQQRQIELFVPREQIARVGVAMRAPATALRRGWVADNVALIKSVDDRFFSDIKKSIREGFESGRSTRAIRRGLQERFQVSRSRAQLIARDQIAKLNGQITKHRQTSAGVTRYRWSDSGDTRVRDTHHAHNGKIFFWSRPPADTGHPGEDFQCRCIPEPVFDN